MVFTGSWACNSDLILNFASLVLCVVCVAAKKATSWICPCHDGGRNIRRYFSISFFFPSMFWTNKSLSRFAISSFLQRPPKVFMTCTARAPPNRCSSWAFPAYLHSQRKSNQIPLSLPRPRLPGTAKGMLIRRFGKLEKGPWSQDLRPSSLIFSREVPKMEKKGLTKTQKPQNRQKT